MTFPRDQVEMAESRHGLENLGATDGVTSSAERVEIVELFRRYLSQLAELRLERVGGSAVIRYGSHARVVPFSTLARSRRASWFIGGLLWESEHPRPAGVAFSEAWADIRPDCVERLAADIDEWIQRLTQGEE